MPNKVVIRRSIYQGIEAVHTSGKTNMYSVADVTLACIQLGYKETARWIDENWEKYIKGAFQGFEVTDN